MTFMNTKQLIWFFGVPIMITLNNLPYAITTGYVREGSTIEIVIIFILWFVPLYFLRDKTEG